MTNTWSQLVTLVTVAYCDVLYENNVFIYRTVFEMNKYTATTANKILRALASGESVNKISKDPNMPDAPTIIGWAAGLNKVAEKADFPRRYRQAREVAYTLMADEIADIADDNSDDIDPKTGRVDNEHVNRTRLRIDTRKWLLSKCLPKVYGDKLELRGDEDNPVPLSISFNVAPAKGPIKVTRGE